MTDIAVTSGLAEAAPHAGAHVVLTDDNRAARDELADYIRANGFQTRAFADFATTVDFVTAAGGICVVVPELTVGARHLFDYLGAIKQVDNAAVLVLSQRCDDMEKIVALELGADDVIPKSADRREVLARIRAAVRRLRVSKSTSDHAPGATNGGWQFLPAQRALIDPAGRPVELTGAEFELLRALVERAGRPVKREELSEIVLGRQHTGGDRGIDNLIAKLRGKLRDPAKRPRMIKTARPTGYVFAGFNVSL